MLRVRFLLVMLAMGAMTFLQSCGDDDENDTNPDEGNGGEQGLSGEMSGTIEKGVYTVTGDIIVPEGEVLTLEPGVILEFDGDGMSPQTSPQIEVNGDLIADGTEADPIMFTVPEDRRDESNAFEGLWGGIQCMPTCESLGLRHCTIEFAGGPAAQSDIYDAGDPRYAVHFANPEGTMVFDHCTFRHTSDDCIRPQGGGKLAMVYCTFYNIGETGGEALNAKDGTVGDVAYNLFYGIATNGSKPKGAGDGVPQSNVNTYNNTFINSGFRRVQAGRGGSINYEGGAKGLIYNNLIVNCRFGVRLRADDEPDVANIEYDYTHYYTNDESDEHQFYMVEGESAGEESQSIAEQQPNDIVMEDPMFVNYDVSTDKMQGVLDESYDFHLQANAPGAGVGYTDFSPVNSTVTAGSITVTLPQPSNFIGAYGQQ